MLHRSAFEHNKEADNGLYETLTGHVLPLRAFIDNKEDDKGV